MALPSVPFTTQVLRSWAGNQQTDYADLLPATHRTKDDHIDVPRPDTNFLKRELLVRRLNDVQDWLWICDHQVLISRDVAITEDPELHLVWSKNRIFLKPIPRYLFSPEFWNTYIQDNELKKCARGFLFSYTALIMYESDFRLARDRGLLPLELKWGNWKVFAKEILKNHQYDSINPRYWYGELRLSRLNKVYRVRQGFVLRGYSKVASHADYADLIRDNFAALATILGYVVIVLTAMQVGFGVNRLKDDDTFQNASYGFTVFSIIAPLVASMGIALLVVVMFVSNWVVTKNYEKKRFGVMNVEPFWRAPGGTFSTVKSNRTNPSDQNV
ncbi:hypothetical protein F5B19DRAFT_492373 [Rostrohypoxylon terebratum]|nr:hypothetical protein F5B19DRAFT_492373 [Rostrohypoxylon terebratum]